MRQMYLCVKNSHYSLLYSENMSYSEKHDHWRLFQIVIDVDGLWTRIGQWQHWDKKMRSFLVEALK